MKSDSETVCEIKNTDDPIGQATLRKLVEKLRMRSGTLFDAARDADSQNVDNRKGMGKRVMPRKTKAERERLKVTCLWCENEAHLHLICAACLAPMSEAEQRQYIRVLPIAPPTRKCVCGAAFAHDAPLNKKWCDGCRLIVRRLEKKARRRKISVGAGNTKAKVKRQIYYYRMILDGRCGQCSKTREPERIDKRTCGRCSGRQHQQEATQ